MKKLVLALTMLALPALLITSTSLNAQDLTKDQITTNDYVIFIGDKGKCMDFPPNISFVYGSYKNGTLKSCEYGGVVEFHFPLRKKFEKSDKIELISVIRATAQLTRLDAKNLVENEVCKENMFDSVTCHITFKDIPYQMVTTLAEQLDYLLVRYVKIP